MPTLLTWVFEGGDVSADASPRMQARATRRGEKQRVHAGDVVDDDHLGQGIIEKIGTCVSLVLGSSVRRTSCVLRGQV